MPVTASSGRYYAEWFDLRMDQLPRKHQESGGAVYIADDLAAERIEMSIVLEKDIKSLVYPTPFELHYSHTWYDRFKNNQVDFIQQRYDEDLPAHFLSTRQRGIHLFGKPIEENFPEIPHQLYVKSLAQDEQWLFESPMRNPEDTVLNPCRFLAFLTEGTVFSKKEGGEWALLTLPKEFHPLIKCALMIYVGKETSSSMDSNLLSGFIEYAKNRGNDLIESTGG